MTRLLAELEIDLAIAEYLLKRGCPTAQPVIVVLDNFCDTCEASPCMCAKSPLIPNRDTPPEDEDPDPDWDELTAKVARLAPAPGEKTFTERMLDRMDA